MRSTQQSEAPRQPRRTCVGCRSSKPQGELLRLARTEQGHLLVSRTAPGRGAWLCVNAPDCVRAASRKGVLGRAFRRSVSPAELAALSDLVSPTFTLGRAAG